MSNISGRESGSGGGIYVDAAAASNAVALGWNTFSGNTADNDGGGLFLEIDSGRANVGAGAFRSNQAANGGGAYLAGSTDGSTGGTVIVSQDAFSSNSASNDGGGLYVDKPITARLGGDVITSNKAGAAGGGLYNNSDSTVMAADTIIYGNSAPSGPNVFGPFSSWSERARR